MNIERYTVFGALPVTLELLGLSLEKRQEKDMEEERENNEDMPRGGATRTCHEEVPRGHATRRCHEDMPRGGGPPNRTTRLICNIREMDVDRPKDH